MTQPLFSTNTPITDQVLNTIAHMPTASLPVLLDDIFIQRLSDADFMRIAVLLAQKSFDEGGCPIGAVIVDNANRRILGKGHNTLVQENHPYNHGETSAIRDAGRQDFRHTSLFTSLSPCEICATLVYMRGFNRVVVGDITNANANGTEVLLRSKGVQVGVLEDQQGIALYARFREQQPALELEDWQGVAAVSGMEGVVPESR
jgi:cytosine deaminase